MSADLANWFLADMTLLNVKKRAPNTNVSGACDEIGDVGCYAA
jgi:hypothetical protein